MKHDVFFSICQTPVDGFMPNERGMFERFFEQARLADDLGFGTAWVAETHLSCQVQKRNPGAVIPRFEGEIGLNTDILQVAHLLFAQTKRMRVGSAIRNILCNGGPIAHAEAVRTFLSLHGLRAGEDRKLELGFASGRFPFSNIPYGIRPRSRAEEASWPALKGLIFMEAIEIFLRGLRGDVFASRDVRPKALTRASFRTDDEWSKAKAAFAAEPLREPTPYRDEPRLERGAGGEIERIVVPSTWTFDWIGVIPFEAPLELLSLTIGAHDAASQDFANEFMPVGVFNLSITPSAQIEETHRRMQRTYNASGGPWSREKMPRTTLIFVDDSPSGGAAGQRERARAQAHKALSVYWQAVEGTLDPQKVAQAVDNALVGGPDEIIEQMNERFHADDRLMLWFDFCNHDSQAVCRSMRTYMERIAPRAQGRAE